MRVAAVAELAYAQDLKSCDRKVVWVRPPPAAQSALSEFVREMVPDIYRRSASGGGQIADLAQW